MKKNVGLLFLGAAFVLTVPSIVHSYADEVETVASTINSYSTENLSDSPSNSAENSTSNTEVTISSTDTVTTASTETSGSSTTSSTIPSVEGSTSTSSTETTISSSTEETTSTSSTEVREDKKMGSSINTYYENESTAKELNLRQRSGTPTINAGSPNTPGAHFIDVSSHNGYISTENYQAMKQYGITGVVVKATQSTWYTNPYFESQVKNALAAGFKVSVYHYAEYTDWDMAQKEASYFANYVKSIGLPQSVQMVIDIEEGKMKNGWLSFNTDYFKGKLNQLGYQNVMYYASKSWFGTSEGTMLNPSKIGAQNMWVAQYPYSVSSNMNWNSAYSAWQWSPQYLMTSIKTCYFDINHDYSGRFTNPGIIEDNKKNVYHFRNSLTSGVADFTVTYGNADDTVYFGDWDGDGKDTFVVRKNNLYYFKNSLNSDNAERSIAYGRANYKVYFGDWDGDGKDEIVVRDGNVYYFKKNTQSGGQADFVVGYGTASDEAFIGDWDGDGKDTIAVRRGNSFYIKNTLKGGAADSVVSYGRAGDIVFVGDWDGDGKDGLIVRKQNLYHVRNTLNSGGVAEYIFSYGRADYPIYFGDWDGSGKDSIAARPN